MVNGGTSNNLINVIFESLMVYESFIMYEINSKLICFGYDGVVIFIDVHSGVNISKFKKVAPFMLVVRFIVHQTNILM